MQARRDQGLLDAIHRAVVAGFRVPQGDRYQIVHEHPASHFIVEATGLDITRTHKCVVIQVVTRPHERESKESFYKPLVRELEATCGLAPSGVVVSMGTTRTRIGLSGMAARNSLPENWPLNGVGMTIKTRFTKPFAVKQPIALALMTPVSSGTLAVGRRQSRRAGPASRRLRR